MIITGVSERRAAGEGGSLAVMGGCLPLADPVAWGFIEIPLGLVGREVSLQQPPLLCLSDTHTGITTNWLCHSRPFFLDVK